MAHLDATTQTQPLGVPTNPNKSASWWWFIVQCSTEAEAIAWRPPQKPELTYACWRPHAAPTTGQPHVHVLLHYKRAQRFSLVQKIGQNCKFCTDDYQKINRRQYCISDVHKKDGSPQNPLAPFQEQGEWGIKMGERYDLIRARDRIQSKKRKLDILKDPELVQPLAKYMKFCDRCWRERPQQLPIPIEEHEFHPWEKEVLKMLDEPPLKRRIIWIWSHVSDTGKTTFGDYLTATRVVMSFMEKYTDTLHLYDGHDIILFDLPRSHSETSRYAKNLLYHQIEKFSNHSLHSSPKYECEPKLIKAHIVVLSNQPPPLDELPKRIIEVNINPPGHVITNHMK